MAEHDSGDWVLQINVKIGDHLVNVRGFSSGFVLDKLDELAFGADRIHKALEALDGRPATAIVEKEKKWGARSQGGRTYPSATPAVSADILIRSELGGVPVGVSDGGTAGPTESTCTLHGQQRKWFGPGVSKASGKEYSASMRCPEKGCKALWEKPDGSFA